MAERIYATGKRKCAVARVWVSPGTGKFTVNKVNADDYFERETTRMVMRQFMMRWSGWPRILPCATSLWTGRGISAISMAIMLQQCVTPKLA